MVAIQLAPVALAGPSQARKATEWRASRLGLKPVPVRAGTAAALAFCRSGPPPTPAHSGLALSARPGPGASRTTRDVVNPACETFAALGLRQPVLASCATRGRALATLQRAHEPLWRGG